MAYNEKIEDQIEDLITGWESIDKKKMFGGICYLTRGNMCFGIWKDFLIVRTGREVAEEKLREQNVRPFDITGRAMKGWVMVSEKGWKNPEELRSWLKIGLDFALALPSK